MMYLSLTALGELEKSNLVPSIQEEEMGTLYCPGLEWYRKLKMGNGRNRAI